MGISRRDFLMRVGQAGGYSAAFLTMQSMGLTPAPAQIGQRRVQTIHSRAYVRRTLLTAQNPTLPARFRHPPSEGRSVRAFPVVM